MHFRITVHFLFPGCFSLSSLWPSLWRAGDQLGPLSTAAVTFRLPVVTSVILRACGLATPHIAALLQMPGQQLRPGHPLSQGLSQHRSSRKASKGAGAITAATRDTAAVGLGRPPRQGAGLAPMEVPGYACIPAPDLDLGKQLVTPGHNTQPGESARERQSSQNSLASHNEP